jgi:predicted RNase H-like nuclease (RuvC/YqgF family)
LASEKEFYHNTYAKIHEYTESDNKIQNIQKQIVKQEKKIKNLVNEIESLQRTKTALSSFIAHDKILDTPSKKIVDKLYLEILHRHADRGGLTHFSLLLEKKKITIDDLRKTLLDSNEHRMST